MKSNVICFFNTTKSWGGGEKWHLDMATLFHEKGYSILIITNKNSELFRKATLASLHCIGIHVTNTSFLNPFKIKKIRTILENESVNTLIMNLPADLKSAGLAAHQANIPKIIYRRGSAIPVKNNFINRFYYQKIIHNILANSQATKNKILQNNPQLIAPDKISVIYNGLDLKTFDQLPVETVSTNKNKIIIGNAGRLVHQKGQELLIKLAQVLLRNNLNFEIHIAGSGPLQESLQKKVNDNQLHDKILFTGFTNNIRSFMSSIDIFVLTSHWEGFGYVLSEAMACHKPVIAFNLSSNPEIIQHNHTGFLVPENDIEKMAEKIISLARDQELLSTMGNNGRKRVEDNFTMNKAFNALRKLILE